MVFPGRFSSGCLRCRQRKVKCDEGKPSCHRCHVYGTPCPGYSDQFQFRHRSNKSDIKASSHSHSHSLTALKEESSSTYPLQKCQEIEGGQQALPISNAPPARGLNVPDDNISLNYFFRRFVSPTGFDRFTRHFSFLPSIYDCDPQGLLETATRSVAHMVAYNQTGHNKFQVLSYLNQNRAIQMLRESILSEEQAIDDKVIITILLLCTLEDISSEGPGEPVNHAPALFHLIEKRGLDQIRTSIGVELLRLSLMRLQIYGFLHNEDACSNLGTVATTLRNSHIILRGVCMMFKTLALRHALLKKELPNLFQECFATLSKFNEWDVEAASYWQEDFQGRGLSPVLSLASGATLYDSQTACTVIWVRSARLILLSSLLVHLDRDAELSQRIPQLEQGLSKTIDDILACVPYALGDVDSNRLHASMAGEEAGAGAMIIVHCIRLVAYCGYTTPRQCQTACEVLSRIGNSIGARSALGGGRYWFENSSWAQEQPRLYSMVVDGALSRTPVCQDQVTSSEQA